MVDELIVGVAEHFDVDWEEEYGEPGIEEIVAYEFDITSKGSNNRQKRGGNRIMSNGVGKVEMQDFFDALLSIDYDKVCSCAWWEDNCTCPVGRVGLDRSLFSEDDLEFWDFLDRGGEEPPINRKNPRDLVAQHFHVSDVVVESFIVEFDAYFTENTEYDGVHMIYPDLKRCAEMSIDSVRNIYC